MYYDIWGRVEFWILKLKINLRFMKYRIRATPMQPSQSLASKIVTTLLLIHFLLNLQSLHVKIIFLSGVWQQLFTIFCLQFYCQSSLSFCFSILEKIRFKSLRHSSILITSQELFSFLFWNGRDSVARYEKWLPDTENGRFYL